MAEIIEGENKNFIDSHHAHRILVPTAGLEPALERF